MKNHGLVGIYEIAQMAGVSAAAVANWRSRHSDFPAPVSDLKSGPVFKLGEVRHWLERRRTSVCFANRDPHYQRILDGLARLADGNLFERCVTDLLRDEHPSLIPVPGGDDAGMDGAWVDQEGAGLLIATVGKNVIGNVTRNLKSHQKAGGKRTRVLVATTQSLSRRRCDNIEKRVDELGCTLAHYPYTQPAIADRLYHNARWCRELLGITTPASALSKVPRVLRPLRDLPLIGRDEDLVWIRETSGDRLIVGQPGTGKTYLEQKLVDEGRALFVTSDDPDTIVEAIRDQQPSTVVVEDAHVRQDTLGALQRFREESGAVYDIVADSWPGRADDVRSLLALDNAHVHELQPLPSELIVELIHATGIAGPHELMHQLVRQSLGYPGRAALLAHSCLSGGVTEVWTGETLARWVGATLRRLVGDEAVQVLAGFAIGGKRGMPIDAVAKLLGIGAGAIRRCIAELAASGVVYEIDSGTVAVFPEQLRGVLVRDHFFRPAAPLPYRKFMVHAPSHGDSLCTILRAKGLGAAVPLTGLLQLLEETNDRDAWATFVWTDRQHAEILLTRYPERIVELAEALVHRLPERAIPAILPRVELPPNDDAPGMKEIKEWIKTAEPGRDEAVIRRRILAKALEAWFANGMTTAVGLALLPATLRPGFEDYRQDPGKRRTFMIRHGALQLEELREVAALWQQILPALRGLVIEDWRPVLAAIDQWVYPGRLPTDLPAEYIKLFKATAAIMLADVASLVGDRPGLLAELQERAEHLGVEFDVHVDKVFATLFPQDPLSEDWRERQERQAAAVRALAGEWSDEQPDAVASKLAEVTHEAQIAGIGHPDYTEYVCRLLADKIDRAIPWIDSLLAVEVQPGNVRPFLDRAATRNEKGWMDRATSCLQHPTHASVGVALLLRTPGLDEDLLTEVLHGAERFPNMVRYSCHHGELPEAHVMRLLRHDAADVVEAAAVGLWECEPEGVIPLPLQVAWTSAVIEHAAKDYDLHRMFESDHELAFMWLMNRARADLPGYRVEDKSIAFAASLLTSEQKQQILQEVAEVFNARHIVRYVIGNDVALYRRFLADPAKKFAHLAPLRRKPDEEWASLAIAALESGYTEEDVAYRANSEGGAFTGSISARYARQADEWEVLQSHDDHRVREMARLGKEASLAEAERWRRREEKEEFAEMYL